MFSFQYFNLEADGDDLNETDHVEQNQTKEPLEVKIKEEPTSPAVSIEGGNVSDAEDKAPKRSSEEERDKEPGNVRPKLPRLSPQRKETEEFRSSLELLQRIFPHQSRAILELILGACEEDVVKAIESLLPDENARSLPFPLPIRAFGSNSLIGYDGSSKSAFSPIAKSPSFIYPGPLSAQPQPLKNPCDKSPNALSAFQPVHSCSPPEVSPSMPERFQFPVVAGYFFNRPPSSAFSLPFNSPLQKSGTGLFGSRVCLNCGFSGKVGDKFCSECGKVLQ